MSSVSPVWWWLIIRSTNAVRFCRHTVRCCYNTAHFHPNLQKRRPIAGLLRRVMGCLWWVQAGIYILPQLLQWYMQYRVILGGIITPFGCKTKPWWSQLYICNICGLLIWRTWNSPRESTNWYSIAKHCKLFSSTVICNLFIKRILVAQT